MCGNPSQDHWFDSIHEVELIVEHVNESAEIKLYSNMNEHADSESWGFLDFKVVYLNEDSECIIEESEPEEPVNPNIIDRHHGKTHFVEYSLSVIHDDDNDDVNDFDCAGLCMTGSADMCCTGAQTMPFCCASGHHCESSQATMGRPVCVEDSDFSEPEGT